MKIFFELYGAFYKSISEPYIDPQNTNKEPVFLVVDIHNNKVNAFPVRFITDRDAPNIYTENEEIYFTRMANKKIKEEIQ